jgi:hypothetical protein
MSESFIKIVYHHQFFFSSAHILAFQLHAMLVALRAYREAKVQQQSRARESSSSDVYLKLVARILLLINER